MDGNCQFQAIINANPHLTGTAACETATVLWNEWKDELGFVLFSELVEEYYQKTLYSFRVGIFFVT